MNKITFSEIENKHIPVKDQEKYLKRLNKSFSKPFSKPYIINKDQHKIIMVKIPKECIKKDE